MNLDDVKKIRSDMRPGHHILTNDVVEAIDWLADALREAQAQTVQMREVVRQDHCDYGDACVLHKMKEVVSTLPAPAARTYDDAIRDAAKAIRDQATRTFGKPTTVANGYAEVVESLLSPAPAVAPVAQNTVTGGWKMEATQTFPAPVDAPKPCPDCKHAGHDGAVCEHYDRPTPESTEEPWCCCDRSPKAPVAFDAEAFAKALHPIAGEDAYDLCVRIRAAALAAGRGAR